MGVKLFGKVVIGVRIEADDAVITYRVTSLKLGKYNSRTEVELYKDGRKIFKCSNEHKVDMIVYDIAEDDSRYL